MRVATDIVTIDVAKGLTVLRRKAVVSRAVSQGQVQYSEMLVDQQLVKTYREIARSDTVLERVIEDLHLSHNIQQLRSLISVTQRGETELIKISVEYPNAYAAAAIADTVAKAFISSVAQIMRVENVVVVDKARMPDKPSKPATLLIMCTVGFAAFVGCTASAYLLESLDDTVRNKSDVISLSLPYIGSIPFIRKELCQSPLVVTGAEDAMLMPRRVSKRHPDLVRASEAYRALRTNLQHCGHRPPQTILVTSGDPGEGKSTIVANLAIAFAQAGKSVVAIDANLREPTLHHLLKVDTWPGLSSVLGGTHAVERAVCFTERPLLKVLPAGPAPTNPSELLSSPLMVSVIASAAAKADVVLIDSPAINSFTDAAILSVLVDCCLLVLSSGGISYKNARSAASVLRSLPIKHVVSVLNKEPQ